MPKHSPHDKAKRHLKLTEDYLIEYIRSKFMTLRYGTAGWHML